MNWSIKLLRVKGIDIKVHLTFVLILIWAAYHWSQSTGAGVQGALFGVVATVLLFVSVTLHELGHSLQTLKFGVQVKDILLMPLGGVAQIEEIPEEPQKELRIAIAGPLINFAIAALLISIAGILNARALTTIEELLNSLGQANWTGMLSYLTMANLGLGLFNLIPAYPMDGGRILRALLAMRLDYAQATAIAVKIGQGLAFLLGLWGFMNASFTLVLIAIFVWMGAGQEGRQVEVKNVLSDMTVRQAMSQTPQALTEHETLEKAVQLTLNGMQSDFPVLDAHHSHLVGFLTAADLLKALKSHGEMTRISDVMRIEFPLVQPEEPLFKAQQRMAEAKIRSLPVVDQNGCLIGLLTAEDINEAYRLLSVYPQLSSIPLGSS
jgi:stage IV sporulation protein FB